MSLFKLSTMFSTLFHLNAPMVQHAITQIFHLNAPTGRNEIAQGIALGKEVPRNLSPEGAQSCAWRQKSFAPSGLNHFTNPLPRAISCCPVGASRQQKANTILFLTWSKLEFMGRCSKLSHVAPFVRSFRAFFHRIIPSRRSFHSLFHLNAPTGRNEIAQGKRSATLGLRSAMGSSPQGMRVKLRVFSL
jgi:hypothetical protein